MTTTGDTMAKTLLISAIPFILAGNFYLISTVLDICQFIYFEKFFNVRYPYNVETFFSVFDTFSVTAFIPNVFDVTEEFTSKFYTKFILIFNVFIKQPKDIDHQTK